MKSILVGMNTKKLSVKAMNGNYILNLTNMKLH